MVFFVLLQGLLVTTALGRISISTPPSLAQCQAWTITWSRGTAPYYVYIYPESYLDESSFLERLGPSNEKQIEYSVKVTAGKKIRFNVRDSINPGYEGTAFTDLISITSGGDNSCFEGGIVGTSAIPIPPTPTSGSGNTDAPLSFLDTSLPSSPSGILPSPLAEASAALSSQPPLTSSIASTSATARNGETPVSGDTSDAGLVLEISYVLVFGSLAGIVGAYFLTSWQSESRRMCIW